MSEKDETDHAKEHKEERCAPNEGSCILPLSASQDTYSLLQPEHLIFAISPSTNIVFVNVAGWILRMRKKTQVQECEYI